MNNLAVQDLRTYFYTSSGIVRAVDGLNIDVEEGESVGLVGESGCGKTMTAFSIMRLVPPPGRIVGGRILFKGKNLLDLDETGMRNVRGGQISMVFQDPLTYLNPVSKIGDQIAEVILLHREFRQKEEVQNAVIRALQMVRMPSPDKIAKSYPFELSGGMRQRVLIATAISCNPSLLIADEPTTALDVTVQMQILELIKQLIRELGISLFLITHDMSIVADVCDRVYVMYAGKIVESANVFDLYDNPKHPYTRGLLKSMLRIDEYSEEFETIDGFVPDLIDLPPGCRFHPRCAYARPICREDEPSSIDIGSGHCVYCWLYR